jgi:hypothetical protein
MEKRKAKCLTLIRTSGEDKLKTAGGKPKISFDNLGGVVSNKPLSEFIFKMTALYFQKQSFPVLNETGYVQNVDLRLNADMTNLEAVNRELEKYDLRFIKADRDVEMLVISDRQKNKGL